MDISKYQELTGTTVPTTEVSLVKAQIKRTRTILEAMLGYPLTKTKAQENHYDEVGKSQDECGGYDVDDALNEADSLVGAYRLYPYNPDDEFFMVDPFTTLYKVKLVYVRAGEEPNGVTIRTLTSEQIRVQKGQGGISKYIARCEECFCVCECQDCVQVAVEADWAFESCLPEDLLYVWADMIGYYTDCKKDIKSETLGSHSYSKFNQVIPEQQDVSIAIIKKYAGPNGTVSPVVPV